MKFITSCGNHVIILQQSAALVSIEVVMSYNKYASMQPYRIIIILVGWLVGCGLTLHSVVSQLYSGGTVLQI